MRKTLQQHRGEVTQLKPRTLLELSAIPAARHQVVQHFANAVLDMELWSPPELAPAATGDGEAAVGEVDGPAADEADGWARFCILTEAMQCPDGLHHWADAFCAALCAREDLQAMLLAAHVATPADRPIGASPVDLSTAVYMRQQERDLDLYAVVHRISTTAQY